MTESNGSDSQTFVDNKGRKWFVELTIPEIEQIKNLLDFDILDRDGGGVLLRLHSDLVLLVGVLWILCEEQAKEKGLDEVGFGRALHGQAFQGAIEALRSAYIHFFPPVKQTAVGKVWDKSAELVQIALEEGETAMDDADMDQLRREIRGVLSTSMPEPSESAI